MSAQERSMRQLFAARSHKCFLARPLVPSCCCLSCRIPPR